MINLNTCVKGQKLKSSHNIILTYVGKNDSIIFPHIVEYSDGSKGSRTNDGYVFSNPAVRRFEDNDIVEILPIKPKRIRKPRKKKVATIPTNLYTNGAAKIFQTRHFYVHINQLVAQAIAAKFDAIKHDGDIYLIVDGKPVKTPFHISDFQVHVLP